MLAQHLPGAWERHADLAGRVDCEAERQL